jgi:hypothetical protein
MRARREERWHYGSQVAVARCGEGQAWHLVAGTGLGDGATGCPRALTRFFSLLQEGRVMRKPRNQCPARGAPVSIRSRDVLATFLLRFRTAL